MNMEDKWLDKTYTVKSCAFVRTDHTFGSAQCRQGNKTSHRISSSRG